MLPDCVCTYKLNDFSFTFLKSYCGSVIARGIIVKISSVLWIIEMVVNF